MILVLKFRKIAFFISQEIKDVVEHLAISIDEELVFEVLERNYIVFINGLSLVLLNNHVLGVVLLLGNIEVNDGPSL